MKNQIERKLCLILLLRPVFLGVCFFVLIGSLKSQAVGKRSALIPVNLNCELRVNPLGVDVKSPGFSFNLNSTDKNSRGIYQTAYQILVSSTSNFKNQNGDLWNSGKIASDKMAYLFYAGKALTSNQKYWWKVRVWDQKGKVSDWSQTANFTMGIIHLNDWQAKWISAAGAEKFALTPMGYKALETTDNNALKWVQVDLGSTMPVPQINLVPMFYADRAGWGFPVRFKVEVAEDTRFKSAKIIADYTNVDFKNPHWQPVHLSANNISGRFIRITASKYYKNGNQNVFALRQIEVISKGKNIASGKKRKLLTAMKPTAGQKTTSPTALAIKAQCPIMRPYFCANRLQQNLNCCVL